MKKICFVFLTIFFISLNSYANQISVKIVSTDAREQSLGTVAFSDTENGLLITPHLKDLPPGLHGFHLHQIANCGDHGMDAGGHYDPNKTNSHEGPYGNGHLGDLPALYVNAAGLAVLPTLAPRLKISDINGLALMIHLGGDNYSNTPPLGGGGARIGCGVLQDAR